MNNIIKDIQLINKDILRLLAESDWDKIKGLMVSRHQRLTHFFVDDHSQIDEPVLSKLKSEIEECDREVRAMMASHKKSTVQSCIAIRNSYKAVNQYRKTHNAIANS